MKMSSSRPWKCLQCGELFYPQSGRQLYCTKECRDLAYKNASLARKGPKLIKLCTVDGCDQSHFAKGLCRLHYSREWARSKRRPLIPKTCLRCDTLFEPNHNNVGYCSNICRTESDRERKWKFPELSHGDWLIIQVTTIRDSDECLSWPYGLDQYGYPTKTWIGKEHLKPVHAALILSGRERPEPPNHHGLHSCDNRRCVNPNHLRWGSHTENMEDMRARRYGK